MVEHVIARYGEISLKGKNRSDFERVLVRNMQRALELWPQVRLERTSGRIMVTLNEAPADEVIARLRKVFGIISLSPVEVTDTEISRVIEVAARFVQEQTKDHPQTFKVEARRSNKQYPLNSMEIAAQVGAGILKANPGWSVDVHTPDLTVFVELRSEGAFIYGEKVPAVGGLPVGSGGRVGLLLSGGIDSPVAGWLAMKRGVELEAIHFHSFPFTSERALQKVETLAGILAQWGTRVRLHTVHFTDVQTAIRKHCPENLGITIMRRMMLRIAAEISSQRRLLALVTGESLGQVASQTLESIHVINEVTHLPVLRPLIAEDKVDIIRRSREIGTYETSILPFEDCCTIFVPKSPRTRPTLTEVYDAEKNLPVEELVRGAIERTSLKTFLMDHEV